MTQPEDIPAPNLPPPASVDDPAVQALAARLTDLSPGDILAFGREIEEEMARFADIVLDQALSRPPPSLDSHLARIRDAARHPAVLTLPRKRGIFGRIFSAPKRDIERLTDRFLAARREIDTVALALEDHIHAVDHGLVVLDRLFAANADKVRDLTLFTAAGWLALAQHREALAAAEQRRETPGADGLVAQQAHDRAGGIERLARRIGDLDRSRVVTLGLLATIRTTQTVGHALVEELRKTIDHAIPAWKASMLVQLQTLRQRHGLDALDALDGLELPAGARAPHPDADATALLAALDKIDRLEKDDLAARERGRATLAEATHAHPGG